MGSRRWSSAFAAIACVAAVGLGAQSPGTQPGGNRTIVTGCIELTEQSVVGTTGTADAPVLDTTFILTGAVAATPTGAAAALPTNAVAPTTYRIDIVDEGKLWLHVGHRVEVTGTIGPGTSSGTYPKLQVQSVKLIAIKCEE